MCVCVCAGGLGESTFYVDYRTEDGSANAGSDYEYSEGTLAFKPGETRKEIKVGEGSHTGSVRRSLLFCSPSCSPSVHLRENHETNTMYYYFFMIMIIIIIIIIIESGGTCTLWCQF